MEFNFKISGDRLISGGVLSGNSGNVNTYVCKFEFAESSDIRWICVFKNSENAYQQVIENKACIIPYEAIKAKGTVLIGCYGSRGDMRISTNWLEFDIEEGAYCEATMPKEPTPDVWETLVEKSVPVVGENGNWYLYDKESGEYKDSGKPSRGEKGDKGEKGEKGEFPVEYVNDAFSNALKGHAKGQSVELSDMSLVSHTVNAVVKSKNIAYKTQCFNTNIGNGTVVKTTATYEKGKTYTLSFLTEDTRTQENPNGTRINFVTYNKPITVQSPISSYADGTRKYITFTAYEDYYMNGGTILQLPQSVTTYSGLCSEFMIEEGAEATEYTPCIEDVRGILVEVTDENGRFDEYVSGADGTVEDVVSSSQTMSFRVTRGDAIVEVTYNRDINIAISEIEEKFTNAIISLGGNV